MTTSVYSFRDGVGRIYHVPLYRMAPNAYGEGGYPLLVIIRYLSMECVSRCSKASYKR